MQNKAMMTAANIPQGRCSPEKHSKLASSAKRQFERENFSNTSLGWRCTHFRSRKEVDAKLLKDKRMNCQNILMHVDRQKMR